MFHIYSRGSTSKGRGDLICSFLKIEKKCQDFGNNALSVFIYGENFSFKMLFLKVSTKKHSEDILYEMFVKVLLIQETLCLEKLLVATLYSP